MTKFPVSVCLISGAEAHRIGRALSSAIGWAEEIIVVLNEEVRDGTEEICRDLGARIIREPWKGYVRQKNSAADKATQPWILSLDADEELPPALREEIAATINDPAKAGRYAAFDFPRCSFCCGRWIRHGDWYPDRVLRLWRQGSAVWVGRDIHERLEVRGEVGHLHHDLLHYTYESINHQIAKIGPYTDPFVRHHVAAGGRAGILDLTARPIWKFLRGYVFRLGFLDGWPGYYIACLSAFSTLTRYTKVCEARLQKLPRP
jgi:glycosyltransferase involved in cell wall biosynthesis